MILLITNYCMTKLLLKQYFEATSIYYPIIFEGQESGNGLQGTFLEAEVKLLAKAGIKRLVWGCKVWSTKAYYCD